jgi:outer membrane protein OmpA-like peptidoglycan-associated protein
MERAMKRFALAVASLVLASCATQQHYTINAPASLPPAAQPPTPLPNVPGPLPGTAGPLTKAGVGKYMDGLEADLRARLKGERIARRGNNLVVMLPNDRLLDRSALSSYGRRVIEGLSQVLVHYDHTQIEVGAYTDTSGGAQQNLDVSQKRAQMLTGALEENGIAPARISAHGYGETNLRIATGENVSEPRNRRFELRITPKPSA